MPYTTVSCQHYTTNIISLTIKIGIKCSYYKLQINGLAQDCSNSIAITLELQQSCAKPSSNWSVHESDHVSPQCTRKPVTEPCLICTLLWSRARFQYKDHLFRFQDLRDKDIAVVRPSQSWVQDCSNSSMSTMELSQSCNKPSGFSLWFHCAMDLSQPWTKPLLLSLC